MARQKTQLAIDQQLELWLKGLLPAALLIAVLTLMIGKVNAATLEEGGDRLQESCPAACMDTRAETAGKDGPPVAGR